MSEAKIDNKEVLQVIANKDIDCTATFHSAQRIIVKVDVIYDANAPVICEPHPAQWMEYDEVVCEPRTPKWLRDEFRKQAEQNERNKATAELPDVLTTEELERATLPAKEVVTGDYIYNNHPTHCWVRIKEVVRTPAGAVILRTSIFETWKRPDDTVTVVRQEKRQ